KLYAFDGILTTLAMVLFNILLLGVFRFGVYGFILSTVLSDAFSIVFLSIAANLPKYLRPELFDRPLLRSMLKYSAPLIPTTILWLVISMSDRFFITAMLGVEQNSYYVAANKIPLIVSTVSAFFTQAWHMSAITENSAKDYEKFFGKVFSAYQSLMYIATAGMILFIKPVMLVMFDPKYESSYKYIPALLLGIMFMCLGSYLSSVYAVTKRSLNSLATSFAAAAANIILNFVLIPKMGIQGAAIATLASYALCFFIRVFDTRRYVKFKVNYLKIFINCILLGGITYLAAIRPKLMYLWISLIFAVILVLNFSAIIKTVKKLLPNFKKA
ncbi:MAG TPA: polysaccharide biosynthesis C-terminal domain-containing protein, partial [Oscillospiraceae bacterium]|nr:polysaccharide biosynthesis C-terminal domain-containing protein [Oscillospiraceae bacterium]